MVRDDNCCRSTEISRSLLLLISSDNSRKNRKQRRDRRGKKGEVNRVETFLKDTEMSEVLQK